MRWTTKLAIRVRSRVAAGLPTGYSGLGGNLTGYCCQQYRPRLDNRGGNGTHRGLCWKQVVPSIPGGDFRRLPTLNKRPLPLPSEAPTLLFIYPGFDDRKVNIPAISWRRSSLVTNDTDSMMKAL